MFFSILNSCTKNIKFKKFKYYKNKFFILRKLKNHITSYKDFPKKGIIYRDVLQILQHPEIFRELVNKMANTEILKEADAIISVDARGFIFGSALSFLSSKPMIVARKSGKLPGELSTQNYSLEYGEDELSVQLDAIKQYKSFVIVDDLIATGGTVNCLSKILKRERKKITGLLVVVELLSLNGKSQVDFPIKSFTSFK
tara:strand:+ start:146 stop:742 length:597 start_codon:yes stop_codon:yes gene_type:complete